MNKSFYLLIWLFFAVSCVNESFDPDPPTDETGYISFTLQSNNGTGGATRSTPLSTGSPVAPDENYKEDFIDFDGVERKDIHVFFFDNGREECLFFPEPERLTLHENSTGNRELRIRLTSGDEDTFGDFDQAALLNKNVVIYIVVNSGLQREEFLQHTTVKSLDDIRATVITAGFNLTEGGKMIKPEKFVMEATAAVYIGGWNNLATLELKRVASKIEVGVYNLQVEGYTAASAEVKMVHFVNRGSLGCDPQGIEYYAPVEADYSTSEYIRLPVALSGTTPEQAEYAEPFYSYPSDWSGDVSKQAYLLVKVNWVTEPGGREIPTYYKLPLSYIPEEVENGVEFCNRLKRNHIYRYYLSITDLGGADPDDAPEISGNLDIMAWDALETIEVSVQRFDWLFVDERNVVIYPVPGENTGVYYIPYKSSSVLQFAVDQPLTATYEWFNSSKNDMETLSYASNHNQFPEVDLNYTDNGQRYIRIASRVPINYVPKNISFKVQNSAQLFSIINIIHYPALYVEAKRSSGMNVSGSNLQGGISKGSNSNLYTITTLAITGDESFNWNWTSNTGLRNKTYTVGDPKNADGNYVDNADNAWVVSPKFIVQSSLGNASSSGLNTGTISYSNTVKRCSQYSEDSYLAGSWRVPTMAELYLISKLQSDANSAVNGALNSVFLARRAWSAGTYLLTGSSASRNTVFDMRDRLGETAYWPYDHVPICVRDVYK